MVVTATTDSIDVVLSASVATNQLHICASYNQTTSSTIIPVKNVIVTNGVSAQSIVPAPSSGNQHQLRYCNIYNTDTTQATVTVRMNYNGTTRNVITTTLQVNESLQYTHRTGWKSFDMNGALKTTQNNLKLHVPFAPPFGGFLTTNFTSTISLATTQCLYIGRATNSHKNILINTLVSTAAASVTWAEAAIYKGIPAFLVTGTLTRCGFTDITSAITSGTGARSFYIPVSGINAGDDLWFVVGNSAVTNCLLRAGNILDVIQAGFVATASTNRPSSNPTLTPSASSSTNPPRITWQGD